jgi:hypothetical protein
MKLSWIHAETTAYNIHSKICNGTFSQHECWKNPQFLQIGLPYKRGKTFCMFGGNFNSLNGFNDFTEKKNRISPKHFFPRRNERQWQQTHFFKFRKIKMGQVFLTGAYFLFSFQRMKRYSQRGSKSSRPHMIFFTSSTKKILLPSKKSWRSKRRKCCKSARKKFSNILAGGENRKPNRALPNFPYPLDFVFREHALTVDERRVARFSRSKHTQTAIKYTKWPRKIF